MTGITKDELMQIMKEAMALEVRSPHVFSDGSLNRAAYVANAILERAAVQMKEESAKINWCTTGEWGEGWCCGAHDALEGAEVAIRALKINTGDLYEQAD